jgi:hypothetical protein
VPALGERAVTFMISLSNRKRDMGPEALKAAAIIAAIEVCRRERVRHRARQGITFTNGIGVTNTQAQNAALSPRHRVPA